ncbi:MAG TPA: FtsQ-type POTRA domain-containing protein [Opitutaceae bacterium]|nr:FtsQ-type POTRA domain-containing protein [Opitutaceae bacterium]
MKPRAMSRGGRRRAAMAVFKSVLLTVTVAALAVLGWLGYETWRSHPHGITSAANLPPVQQIALSTDGVLDDHWIKSTLALPSGATLMDLDLPQLHERLLAGGQVHSASLTRRFPATLAVHLAERSPVARVMVQQGGAEPDALLVARDGVVYAGVGYEEALLGSLVWLDGFRLTRAGGRIQPIAGMELVADLIAKARNEVPHLYETWRVISLARLADDGEIEVRATDVERIRFGRNQDFFRQLAQLDVLLELAQSQPDRPLREINLAIGRTTDGRVQVPVTLDVPEPTKGHRSPTRPANTSSFFNPQKKPSAREL